MINDELLARVMFFDNETNKEIAHVELEDSGDYWLITACMADENGNISETIDKDSAIFEYVQRRYRSAITLVERLLENRTNMRVEESDS